MTTSLFIIGAGGFGREVHCIIKALENAGGAFELAGFVDDNPSDANLDRVADLGSQVVGCIDGLARSREPFSVILAVGSAPSRRAIAAHLSRSPVTFPVLVHPDATIGYGVRIAEGVVVAAGARLSANVHVGRHAHVDQNATIGHDSVLGDFSRLNPQACVSGDTRRGRKHSVSSGTADIL